MLVKTPAYLLFFPGKLVPTTTALLATMPLATTTTELPGKTGNGMA